METNTSKWNDIFPHLTLGWASPLVVFRPPIYVNSITDGTESNIVWQMDQEVADLRHKIYEDLYRISQLETSQEDSVCVAIQQKLRAKSRSDLQNLNKAIEDFCRQLNQ